MVGLLPCPSLSALLFYILLSLPMVSPLVSSTFDLLHPLDYTLRATLPAIRIRFRYCSILLDYSYHCTYLDIQLLYLYCLHAYCFLVHNCCLQCFLNQGSYLPFAVELEIPTARHPPASADKEQDIHQYPDPQPRSLTISQDPPRVSRAQTAVLSTPEALHDNPMTSPPL